MVDMGRRGGEAARVVPVCRGGLLVGRRPLRRCRGGRIRPRHPENLVMGSSARIMTQTGRRGTRGRTTDHEPRRGGEAHEEGRLACCVLDGSCRQRVWNKRKKTFTQLQLT
jgi:hypothetical protein